MTYLQAFILGIVQGLTEFLPISSSGHLVVVPALLGWRFDSELAFAFDVWVQLGTLLAVIVYFWGDLWRIGISTTTSLWRPNQWSLPETRMGLYLVIASLPAVITGVLIQDQVEAFFSDPRATAGFLLVTAAFLLAAEWLGKRNRKLESLTWLDALVMGLFQALALLPGISRSGSTITGGMLRDLDRPAAARFSFLMAVPVMLGSSLLAGLDILGSADLLAHAGPFMLGMAVAGVIGFTAIHYLLRFLASRPIAWFSPYLVLLAAVVFILVA